MHVCIQSKIYICCDKPRKQLLIQSCQLYGVVWAHHYEILNV